VPAKAIPPERRCYLPAQVLGRIKVSSALERNKQACAGLAVESLCQAVRLQDTAYTAWAGVALVERDYLLPEREMLGGGVKHIRCQELSCESLCGFRTGYVGAGTVTG